MADKIDRATVARELDANTLILRGMDLLRNDVKNVMEIVKVTGYWAPSQAGVWPPNGTGTDFTAKFALIAKNKSDINGMWGYATDPALSEAADITAFLLNEVKVASALLAPAAANSLLDDVRNLVAGNAVTVNVQGQQPQSVQLYGGWPSDPTKTYWEIVVALGILLNQIAMGTGGGKNGLPPGGG